MSYNRDAQRILTIIEALQRQTVDELKKLAALVSKAQKPNRKDELVTFVQRYLEGELHMLWTELDELQQAAVAEVVHSSNTNFPQSQFLAKYGQEPNWGKTSVYSYKYYSEPSKLCLFFYGYDQVMPDELKERLKAFVPPPTPVRLETLDEPPKVFHRRWKQPNPKLSQREGVDEIPVVQCLMERAAPQDLQAVLRLTGAGKVAVSEKTRYPSTATMQALIPLLQGGDYYDNPEIGAIKAFAWPLIVQAAGLAELSGKRLQLTSAGQKALSDPPHKTLRTLWKKWLKTKLLDELRRIDSIKGQTGKGQRGLTATDKRRSVIAAALADCPVGHWVAVDKFFRYMQAATYDFEVTRSPENLSIENSYYGNLGYEGSEDWEIFQGRYTLCLLLEYAATLGLLDVAYVHPSQASQDYYKLSGIYASPFFSRYDGLVYFCLNPLGAYCLGITDEYSAPQPEVQHRLRVLPNLEIAAMGEPLSASEVLQLELYAEKVSDAVWRLNQTQILNAVAQRHSVSDLQGFLVALSGGQPLPKTVTQFLADVETRTNSLQNKGSAILIECADPALAVLIANDSRTKGYCLLAGDRSLVVPTESETKFRNALQKLGYSLP